MENHPLASRRAWAVLLVVMACMGELAWVVLPVSRRIYEPSLWDGVFFAFAPIAFIYGLFRRRVDVLLLGVPLGWLCILPFASRDGLGSTEALFMALGLAGFILVALGGSAHPTRAVKETTIVWRHLGEEGSPVTGTRSAIWLILGCVFGSAIAVLGWSSLHDAFVSFTPGSAARIQVAMIFTLGLMGVGLVHRSLGSVFDWRRRRAPFKFLGLGCVFMVLFALWRWV